MEFFNDDFDRIFNDMTLFNYKPMRLVFNSNVKDMSPYVFKKTDNGYECIVKTLGISEKDINVTVEDYGIKIKGESELDGEKYNTDIEIAINESVMADLKEVNFKSKDGITIIDLVLENKRKKVLINGK